jgi:uncharacterized phage-associated protein
MAEYGWMNPIIVYTLDSLDEGQPLVIEQIKTWVYGPSFRIARVEEDGRI